MARSSVFMGIGVIIINLFIVYSFLYAPFMFSSLNIPFLPGPIYRLNPLSYAESFPVSVNSTSLTSNDPGYIFIYNTSGTTMLNEILDILSLNASRITPEAYWIVSDLAGFFSNYTLANNYSIYFLTPIYYDNVTEQPNFTEVYLNISDVYAYPDFLSFPPSDSINFSSSIKIFDTLSVQSYATWSFSDVEWHYGGSISQNTTYYYYTVILNLNKYVVVNNSQYYYEGSESYQITVKPWGSSPDTIYTYVNYNLGYENLRIPILLSISDTSSKHKVGNYSYVITPSYPPKINPQFYGYLFYNYTVSLSLWVNVFNGSFPFTELLLNGTKVYETQNRYFNYVVNLSESSYSPKVFNVSLITSDTVKLGDFSINRYWSPGYILICPQVHVNTDGHITVVSLSFNLQDHLIQNPPYWVFNHVPQNYIFRNNYANNYLQEIGYYYGLYKLLSEIVSNFTTNTSYIKYVNWELLFLSSEISMQINYTKPAQNFTVALISKEGNETQGFMQMVFIISWSLWYTVINGSYYFLGRWIPWTYGIFTGFEIPDFYTKTALLPYIVLNNSKDAYLLYNIQSFKVTSWWYDEATYNNNSISITHFNVFTSIPLNGSVISFNKYYNFDNIPIYIQVLTTTANISEYVNGPGGI